MRMTVTLEVSFFMYDKETAEKITKDFYRIPQKESTRKELNVYLNKLMLLVLWPQPSLE